jgi:SNF family Na+-dependent transporter
VQYGLAEGFTQGFSYIYNPWREVPHKNITRLVHVCVLNVFAAFEYTPVLHDVLQAAEGTGLAFIVFTQAIVELPGAPFWAVIFFLMLLALGLGSQIGILEGMLCTIFDIDIFKRIRKQYVTGE